jgi:hypothetical protein
MKKFRLILMSLVISAGVGGAFASADPPCVYQPQYIRNLIGFQPAGVMGVNYACILCPFSCTYYLPDPVLQPNNYVPCRQGVYLPIIL